MGQSSYPQENKSGILIIMAVILVIITGLAFTLISLFKPESGSFNDSAGGRNNTPEKHIENIEGSILKIFNLTNEALLFDDLFDELVYTESPQSERIAEFLNHYKNYSSLYSKDKIIIGTSDWLINDYDSTSISHERQRKFLEKSISDLLKSIDIRKKIMMAIPVSFPIEKENALIISGFGMRDHPILDEPRLHTGIDIKAPVGTAILATANGKVINTTEQIGYGYGRPCVIEHKYGYQTLYGHMVRLEVYKDKIVQKGDVIGRVGDTGLSQGPHLHYEVRKNGKPLNPSFFIFEGLKEKEYQEIVDRGTQH
jgi:murein DD-endopeptidase MepM/ murein hydrolase activator NlpD